MFPASMTIAGFDPELAAAIDHERVRQEDHIELIASENYASSARARGPGLGAHQQVRRRLPGQALLRRVRIRRRRRAAGDRPREEAVRRRLTPTSSRTPVRRPTPPCILALLKPGDTLLGMSLDHGGHLTHGAKVNFSGKIFNAVQYGLDPATGEIDYAQVERLAREHKPKMIIAGLLRLFAHPRLAALPRRSPTPSARIFLVRHGARRRPGRGGRVPQPGALRRRRHDHHAQDAARSARRPDPRARQRRDHEEAQLDDLPRHAGRPADARHRGQGGGLPRGAAAGVRGLPEAGRRQRARDGDGVPAARHHASSPAAPTTTCSWST